MSKAKIMPTPARQIAENVGDAEPVEGYYAIRLTKGGPLTPVHIWHGITPDPDFPDNPMDRSLVWHFVLGHEEVELDTIWPWCAKNPITERDWRHMLRMENWARTEAPAEPEANPRHPVDFNTMKPMF